YTDDVEDGKDKWSFVGNLNTYSSVSDKKDGGADSGGGINGLLAPGYRINERTLATLMYNGEYHKQLDFYSDNVGTRERTEFQRHAFTSMVRFKFGDRGRYSIRPSLFHAITYNKDADGSDWSDGLYNYRETGAGLDFEINDQNGDEEKSVIKSGIQVYERKYPNFVSLLDLATGIGIERDERDYTGTLVRLGYAKNKRTGLTWSTDYFVLYKDYEDKKVVNFNGVLTNDGQQEYLQNLALNFSYVPELLANLRIGLNIAGARNRSNQNYYDGMGSPLDLTDDVYINHFYDYTSYRVSPSYAYSFEFIPLTVTATYSVRKMEYDDRMAQYADASYKPDKQEEVQEGVSLRVGYDILEKLNIYAQWQYLDTESNNDNRTVYEYDHTVHHYHLGLTYNY
ncbi:MAG: hypothetical protein KAK02_08460, partial [Desulfobulbaceae bacterium]|nr:hypothetical protein [Desulfobulbaceae bacterium]